MGPDLKFFFKLNDISSDSVRMLWYYCLHPAFNTNWAHLYTSINILLCFAYTGLAIKGILVSYDNDIFFTSLCLQTCILMAHTISNVLSLHTHRRTLLKLLQQKSRFWKMPKNHQQSLHVEISVEGFNFAKNLIRFYFAFSLFSAILFDLQPFTTGLLPTVCYVPEGWFNYLTIVLWYLSYVAVISIIGTACLFCSLAISLVEQFQLLAHRFRHMCNNTSGNIWKELEVLVDYHNFLIRYCEELNATFSSIFLLDFLVSIASASVSVFIFMQPGAWTNRLKCATHFIVILIEMGFYCVPLEIVTSTAIKLSDMLYDSKWYEIDRMPFKKCLTVIISRAQKPMVFSGYGLVNINLNTYVIICKAVFSFYTYLNTVKSRSTE